MAPSPRDGNRDPFERPAPADGDEDGEGPANSDNRDLGIDLEERETGMDDAVASDLAVGELVDALSDQSEAGPDGGVEIDPGLDFIDFEDQEKSSSDDDLPGAEGDDVSLGVDGRLEGRSSGHEDDEAEQPSGDDVDEKLLPEIDSDSESDLSGGIDLGETTDLPNEPPPLAWASMRWERVPTPLVAVPMNAIAVTRHQVGAAGAGVVILRAGNDGEFGAIWPALDGWGGEELTAIVLDENDDCRLHVTCRQHVLQSSDGGACVQEVRRAASPASCFVQGAYGVRDGILVLCEDEVEPAWLIMSDGDSGMCPFDVSGRIAATAIDRANHVHCIIERAGGFDHLCSADGIRWKPSALGSECVPLLRGARPLLAVRDSLMAIGNELGQLAISNDRGSSWTRVAVPPVLTALCVVENLSRWAVVGTVFVESQDRSCLFLVDERGQVRVVADLSPDVSVMSDDADESEGLGQASCVRWDAHRGWLWVAGRFGLSAWRAVNPA